MTVTTPEDVILRKDEFQLFQRLMYEHAGIALSDCKMSLVEGRLHKRIRQLNLSCYRDYYARVTTEESELRQCINLLTTNETYFFRHKRHWDYLIDRIIPLWLREHPGGGTFRVWSAAASTGEEAYSAAMVLHDAFTGSPTCRYDIEATDINDEVLSRARLGVYSDYAVQKLTPEGLRRYFTKEIGTGRYRIRDDVRAHVRFFRGNLLEPHDGAPYDLVFLRNVIIYFDADSKERVIRHVANRVRRGGHLILGGAETLPSCQNIFLPEEPTIYRKKLA